MPETPKDQANVISSRLAPVIAAAAERIHYAEARRANYSVMAGALIAAGIAIFTFALGTIDTQWMRFGAVSGSLSMIVLGAVILYVFGKQTNRYPFTSATNTWKWFYRDALPDQSAFDLKMWQPWKSQKKRVEKAYAEQLPKFKETMLKLSDGEADLDQDIQQAYVLHINEKYKNFYLGQLRSIFNSGLVVIAFLMIAGGLVGVWYETGSHKTVSSSFSNSAWTYKTEYRLVSSPTSGTAEWVVRISISNKTDWPLSMRRLHVRDDGGWLLPVDITYATAMPHSIAPRQTAVLFAAVKTSAAVREAVASMDVDIQ